MTLALDTAGGLHELPMAPAGDGWFETFADCGAHTRYRYRLDEALTIPDPASRSQPEGADGPSEVIDPRAFTWRHVLAWQAVGGDRALRDPARRGGRLRRCP